MRRKLALALVGSVLIHALLLRLLPFKADVSPLKMSPSPSRLQVRMLPQVQASLPAPRPEIETQALAKSQQNSPLPQKAAVRSQPALAATSLAPADDRTDTPAGFEKTPPPLVSSNPDRDVEPRVPAPSLNLNLPTAKLPARTALQTTIEQQSVRLDAVALSFQRAMGDMAPTTTEIKQTVDANGNATVKVRTPGGTYCLQNTTPPGATLYELKTLAGNCNR